MTPDARLLEPIATQHGEGEARWWFDCLAEIKLTAEQRGGALSILEITEPPNPDGVAGPLHVHYREDETFWTLEGDATLEIGDTSFEAQAGDVAFGPRGGSAPRTVGRAGCRMLFIMTPGGFENLVREMSVPAQQRTTAPASEPDWAHVAAVARANGCELLA